eukprot:m.32569 g.32569  ORF g.32569 m.32569 type:complete len:72 (-) comp9795_c0_seq1:2705-2920(-)
MRRFISSTWQLPQSALIVCAFSASSSEVKTPVLSSRPDHDKHTTQCHKTIPMKTMSGTLAVKQTQFYRVWR